MNFRPLVLASLAAAALTLGTGCSNKTAAERDSLAKQNHDLQAQLDQEKAARAAAESRANAVTESATAAPTTEPAAPSMESTDTTGGVATADLGPGITKGRNEHGENTITVSSDVLFDSGKAALKPAAKKALDKVAAILKKEYAGRELRIEGYTDPNPVRTSGWDDNWDLGAARARSVLLYLESRGIHNMYIASFGDTKATGSAGTATTSKKGKKAAKSTNGYAADRRVEIVVVKGGM